MDKVLQTKLAEKDAHNRLRCAIEGRRYEKPADRVKVAQLTEALSHPISVTLPDGIHQRLAEALDTVRPTLDRGKPPLPAGIHDRLRRAL
jgi:hypothetical protein